MLFIPTVFVKKGSSKFNCNLVKSYLCNYGIVYVSAEGEAINLCVWILSQLRKELTVTQECISRSKSGQPQLSFFVQNGMPSGVRPYDDDACKGCIKVGPHSNVDIIKRLIISNNASTLIAAGHGCLPLCEMVVFAYDLDFAICNIDCIETIDDDGKPKVGLQVYISHTSPQNALLGMQCEDVVQ